MPCHSWCVAVRIVKGCGGGLGQNNYSLRVSRVVPSTAHLLLPPPQQAPGGLLAGKGRSPQAPSAEGPSPCLAACPAPVGLPGLRGKELCEGVGAAAAPRPQRPISGGRKSIEWAVVPKGQTDVCVRQMRTVRGALVVACRHQTCLEKGWSCYRHEG